MRINAKWPENYHMVFHYVLDDDKDATGEVVVRHVNGDKGVTQRSRVTFKPTVNGSDVTSQFVVVADNGTSTQFAMLERQYDIQFTTNSDKLLLVSTVRYTRKRRNCTKFSGRWNGFNFSQQLCISTFWKF